MTLECPNCAALLLQAEAEQECCPECAAPLPRRIRNMPKKMYAAASQSKRDAAVLRIFGPILVIVGIGSIWGVHFSLFRFLREFVALQPALGLGIAATGGVITLMSLSTFGQSVVAFSIRSAFWLFVALVVGGIVLLVVLAMNG